MIANYARLYLNSFQSQTGNQVYNYALWNYCTGTSESIQSCAHPVAAFNWADTPGVGQAIPQQFRTSSIVKSLFLALFILYFIGTIFSFLFWLISMPIIACVRGKRHAPGGIMSSLVLLNLLIMIASLVLALVISISANKAVAGSGWTGRCGNSMWITIGAVVSLFFAWLCYNGACCCPGGGALRRRRRRDRVADEAHAEKGLYHDEKTAAPETDNTAGATTAATSPNPGATNPGVGYSSSPHPAGGAQNAAPHTPQLLQGYLPKNTPAQGGQYTAAGSPSPTPMNRPQVEPFKYELPHGTIHSQYSPALTHNYQ